MPLPAVAVRVAECADSLVESSSAVTVKLWLLPGSRPITLKVVPVPEVVAMTLLPS